MRTVMFDMTDLYQEYFFQNASKQEKTGGLIWGICVKSGHFGNYKYNLKQLPLSGDPMILEMHFLTVLTYMCLYHITASGTDCLLTLINTWVGWLVVLRIYVASAVFHLYRDLEAGDNKSKFKWRGRESNPGPLAPQAKSLTNRQPLLPLIDTWKKEKLGCGEYEH